MTTATQQPSIFFDVTEKKETTRTVEIPVPSYVKAKDDGLTYYIAVTNKSGPFAKVTTGNSSREIDDVAVFCLEIYCSGDIEFITREEFIAEFFLAQQHLLDLASKFDELEPPAPVESSGHDTVVP